MQSILPSARKSRNILNGNNFRAADWLALFGRRIASLEPLFALRVTFADLLAFRLGGTGFVHDPDGGGWGRVVAAQDDVLGGLRGPGVHAVAPVALLDALKQGKFTLGAKLF